MNIKQNKNKVVAIYLSILFHFYRNHKDQITDLRLWFIARHILDETGKGWVSYAELSKTSKLTENYLVRICRKSKFFRQVSRLKIHYLSAYKIAKKHKVSIFKKIRYEKLTKVFRNQFLTKKKFLGFITKWACRQTHIMIKFQQQLAKTD